MSQQEPNDHFEHRERPTVDHPVNAPGDAVKQRAPLKPLLITVAFFVVLGVLYFLGTFLINAD